MKRNTLVSTLAATALLAVAGHATAGPSCNAPQNTWMKETDFKAMVVKQGYTIKTFKVSKGQCYEIYGQDKSGKKVEIYFDPATGKPIESK